MCAWCVRGVCVVCGVRGVRGTCCVVCAWCVMCRRRASLQLATSEGSSRSSAKWSACSSAMRCGDGMRRGRPYALVVRPTNNLRLGLPTPRHNFANSAPPLLPTHPRFQRQKFVVTSFHAHLLGSSPERRLAANSRLTESVHSCTLRRAMAAPRLTPIASPRILVVATPSLYSPRHMLLTDPCTDRAASVDGAHTTSSQTPQHLQRRQQRVPSRTGRAPSTHREPQRLGATHIPHTHACTRLVWPHTYGCCSVNTCHIHMGHTRQIPFGRVPHLGMSHFPPRVCIRAPVSFVNSSTARRKPGQCLV